MKNLFSDFVPRYKISAKFTPTGLTSMLVISEVESSDTSHYKCDMQNLYGNTSVIVFLFVMQDRQPLSPYNIRVDENNKTSVTVTWEHQKKGNGSVLFIVEYTPSSKHYISSTHIILFNVQTYLPITC